MKIALSFTLFVYAATSIRVSSYVRTRKASLQGMLFNWLVSRSTSNSSTGDNSRDGVFIDGVFIA